MPSARLAAQARELIDGELHLQLDIPRLERELRTPARTITQAFRQQLGTTIVEYVASARMTRARELVEQGDLPIKRIASMVGFAHVSNFTSAFVRRHGITPARCRARQRGA